MTGCGTSHTPALHTKSAGKWYSRFVQTVEKGKGKIYAPPVLSDRSLRIYKTVVQRAIAAGKDQLGVLASRFQMIVNALK